LPRRHGLLGDLDRRADVFTRLGPNWFASVMGTGIVATAAATLPVQWPGLRGFAGAVWVLSAVWLITLAGAEVVLWTRHRSKGLLHHESARGVTAYQSNA
jgi:tellurite resistance protein TehA-like permease